MPQYTNNLAITIPAMVGLANGIKTNSNAVNNTITQYDAIDIEFKVMLGTGTSSSGFVRYGILASDDGGVTYDDYLVNGKPTFTVSSGISDGASITTRFQVTPVPQFWKLAVGNFTGATFNATGANFSSFYCGIDDFDSLNLITAQINVTTSITLLAAASLVRSGMAVSNQGTDIIYLGDSAVTTSTGYPLDPSESIQLLRFTNNALYGVVTTTTSAAAIMQW